MFFIHLLAIGLGRVYYDGLTPITIACHSPGRC